MWSLKLRHRDVRWVPSELFHLCVWNMTWVFLIYYCILLQSEIAHINSNHGKVFAPTTEDCQTWSFLSVLFSSYCMWKADIYYKKQHQIPVRLRTMGRSSPLILHLAIHCFGGKTWIAIKYFPRHTFQRVELAVGKWGQEIRVPALPSLLQQSLALPMHCSEEIGEESLVSE